MEHESGKRKSEGETMPVCGDVDRGFVLVKGVTVRILVSVTPGNRLQRRISTFGYPSELE